MWEAHNWTKNDRLWIGLFTAFPVLVGLAIPIAALVRPNGLAGGEPCLLCLAHPLMVFMILLVYIPAAVNNRRIGQTARRLWLVGFLAAGIVVIPLYWLRHIWNVPYDPDPDLDAVGSEPGREEPSASGAHMSSAPWPGAIDPRWDRVDEASWESFPASDPPPWR